jgi:TPR repeat protein
MKRRALVLALLLSGAVNLLLGGCAAVTPSADYQTAKDAYNRGDYARAHRELLPLAEQGEVEAQYRLAQMFRNGEGVPQDYAEAMKWYRLAAKQGNASAGYYLGDMYANGEGVVQDILRVVRWFRFAAELGHSTAQYKLAGMYWDGDGVPKDPVQAYAWFSLASAQGDYDAYEARALLKQEMTPVQVAEAKKLSRELFERIRKKQ